MTLVGPHTHTHIQRWFTHPSPSRPAMLANLWANRRSSEEWLGCGVAKKQNTASLPLEQPKQSKNIYPTQSPTLDYVALSTLYCHLVKPTTRRQLFTLLLSFHSPVSSGFRPFFHRSIRVYESNKTKCILHRHQNNTFHTIQ